METKYAKEIARIRKNDLSGNESNTPEKPRPVANRYGLSESEWAALTPEQRVIHYNRQNVCEHLADIDFWPADLRESYSFDPYFHTAHMIPCTKKPDCECQMCLQHIGIERNSGNERRQVNASALRKKLLQRFKEREKDILEGHK